jgi:hypothetical protein
MRIQVRSSARRAERRSAVVVPVVVCLCLLVCTLSENSVAQADPQAKPSRESTERFRFRVTDSEHDLPIPGAAISLVYWQKKKSAEEKKEIELKSDKNGVAEFRRVHADKLAISVTVKGYRSCRRWIRSMGTEEIIRIRLERWPNRPK